MQSISFINPHNQEPLQREERGYAEISSGKLIAPIVNEIPRFVAAEDDYAHSFGFQWNRWHNSLSESRGSLVRHKELIYTRTGFDKLPVEGKTLLECGMGGGDDTEALLTLPFKEIHSFDISNSVERARKYLNDERLTISQASIYEIPYPDEVFDFVFCHRVIMHTPDPFKAIDSICKKLKPSGYLFIHSYKKSPEYMKEFRYKYRPWVSRLPKQLVYLYVSLLAWPMHLLSASLNRLGRKTTSFRYQYMPWYFVHKHGEYRDMSVAQRIELEKMITFDALTPAYDKPMTTSELVAAMDKHNIDVISLEDSMISPVYATGRKREAT